MSRLHTALLGAGAVLASAMAGAASAATIVVTSVGTGNPDLGNVTVQGYGQPWTTPILMTVKGGGTLVVFCDDLNHEVNVGGGQNLHYALGPVTVNGLGMTLSEDVSNEMGQLANIGRADYLHGDEDGAIAAQAAIWGLEYATPVSSSDATIEADITSDLMVKSNGKGYALGLIGLDGQQSQILGGVPEPATWAMMLTGFGAIGSAIRNRRRRVAAAA